MKRAVSWPQDEYDQIVARCEEENVSFGEFVREATRDRLTLTDPGPPKQEAVDYGTLVQRSVGMPKKWWVLLGAKSDEEGYPSMMAAIRELVRVWLDIPVPEKPERAPRNQALTDDARMGFHHDSWNDMRNLRSQEPEETISPWEWVRQNQDKMFYNPICDCLVPGCANNGYELHKHPCRDLLLWADKQEDDWVARQSP